MVEGTYRPSVLRWGEATDDQTAHPPTAKSLTCNCFEKQHTHLFDSWTCGFSNHHSDKERETKRGSKTIFRKSKLINHATLRSGLTKHFRPSSRLLGHYFLEYTGLKRWNKRYLKKLADKASKSLMFGKLIHKLMALMKVIDIVETKLPPKSLGPLFPKSPVSSYNRDSKKASWNWHHKWAKVIVTQTYIHTNLLTKTVT